MRKLFYNIAGWLHFGTFKKKWIVWEDEAQAMHLVPINDVIRHVAYMCPCMPIEEPVKRSDGSIGWLVTHTALDERDE